jgi:hypothetical protein
MSRLASCEKRVIFVISSRSEELQLKRNLALLPANRRAVSRFAGS